MNNSGKIVDLSGGGEPSVEKNMLVVFFLDAANAHEIKYGIINYRK
jgi:hypothetical protein